jgi:hypothetical protein
MMNQSTAALSSTSSTRIFLLMGQSNMQGCGRLTSVDPICDPGIRVLRDGRWEAAREPLHEYRCTIYPDGGAGMGMSFAAELRGLRPQTPVGLVPCAESGSALSRWLPGADLYRRAWDRARAAAAAGTICGALWHQGEADTKHEEDAAAYCDRFTRMVEQLRVDLRIHHLPVVVGELGRFLADSPPHLHWQAVNAELDQAAARIRGVALVSSAGLTCSDRHDNVHFDAVSQRELGRRYARAYLSLPGD